MGRYSYSTARQKGRIMSNIIDITPFRGKHEGKLVQDRLDRQKRRSDMVTELERVYGKSARGRLETALEGMDETTRIVCTPALDEMFDLGEL